MSPRFSGEGSAELLRVADGFLLAIDVERGASVRTLEAYGADLRRYLDFLEQRGRDRVGAIVRRDVLGYLQSCEEAGLGPRSRARMLSSVRGFHRWACESGLASDDPTDDLRWHQQIADPEQFKFSVKAYPTFRPDKALNVHQPGDFNAWLGDLEKTNDTNISSLSDLRDALKQRHDFFHSIGGRLSDHGLSQCFASFGSDASAATIFDKARAGSAASPEEQAEFATHLMVYFGQLDAEKGWTKQMHIGALRNNNRRLFREVGADIGCDSIGDLNQADALSAYLGRLDDEDALPKVVLYNLNPRDNYVFATIAGNFQDGRTAGKIQFGSGWLFLDQKQAMEWQIDALSNCGLLSRFIGMLTDSRSFMSFPRHEYFRRTLCNLLGHDIENGLIPDDDSLLQPLVENICYGNARDFLGLETDA